MSEPLEPTTKLVILTPAEARQRDAKVVRAFLERVEKRLPPYSSGRGADAWLRGYRNVVLDELAAMEDAE